MEEFSKYDFSAINIKKKVAVRFRKFSKEISKSNTEALAAMLNFFDWNDLSPHDNLGVKNERTNKRINAVIAILKNIEKHQTKPMNAMLQTLFEETTNLEKEEESFGFETPLVTSENEELEYYREGYYNLKEKYHTLKLQMDDILSKVTYVKSNFGKGSFKLDIDITTLEELKKQL
ncbi:BfmA/BtgA family mobilization protein [Flagellimonas hymeniacidonis]|uniref:BfmA/BtgA family mobilization protein n=1 Tax=Flagellimonas hymeniacidonis TaxID=2603628 RepID=UPI001FE6BB74|nr:BfmA/BtgA family mobilization protein [Flagellimonas hymeniacidonis]